MKNNISTFQSVFYLYLSSLPLTAFWAMRLNKDMWTSFLNGNSFQIILTFFGFFLSGIFGLLIVQNTPSPKNIFAGIYMLFDVPIQIAIIKLLGNKINLSEILIIDFCIELIGIILAVLYLNFLNKKIIKDDIKIMFYLIVAFGSFILLSNYGKITLNYISNLSFVSQLPLYFAVASTVVMYIKNIKEKDDNMINNLNKPQIIMSNFSAVLMIILWLSMISLFFI